MNRMNDEIHKILQLLELPIATAEPLLNALSMRGNLDNAQKQLVEFKKVIKKQRRHLAKKYHPDLNNNNAERMKTINRVIDNLLQSEIKVPEPMPIYHTFVVNVQTGNSSTTTSSHTGYYY